MDQGSIVAFCVCRKWTFYPSVVSRSIPPWPENCILWRQKESQKSLANNTVIAMTDKKKNWPGECPLPFLVFSLLGLVLYKNIDGHQNTNQHDQKEPGQLDVDVIVMGDSRVCPVAPVAAKIQIARDIGRVVDLCQYFLVNVGLDRHGKLEVVDILKERMFCQIQATLGIVDEIHVFDQPNIVFQLGVDQLVLVSVIPEGGRPSFADHNVPGTHLGGTSEVKAVARQVRKVGADFRIIIVVFLVVIVEVVVLIIVQQRIFKIFVFQDVSQIVEGGSIQERIGHGLLLLLLPL
mmetsp:Transcript_20016/g.49812  ORF Transcript_20016/g.49812 Transcript_20016/m.49812 type:complete len:292 (-) Transcript_20016:109-984(-)